MGFSNHFQMTSPHKVALLFLCALGLSKLSGQSITSHVWTSDNLDGTYKNPILHADYSDPDICRVGGDFYLTSSSFNSVPGLPILHSTDLVNWQIINYAVPLFDAWYDIPQHGNGVWAPCIKYQNGIYYIYWGDPDRGIYMVSSTDPNAKWSAPVLVKKAFGNIDPSPLWDDDGKAYLVHAFANSRAGVKSILQIHELSATGDRVLDQGTIVFDGHKNHPTIEGPKLYKRNGYYYIFAPAGGVPTGWQLILRSKNIYGPYEEHIALSQGSTAINGPHQGGWVELDNGENWFVHFQDKGAYGRVVHLQPMKWVNDWPVIGNDADGDGTGEPFIIHKKPSLPVSLVSTPPDTDEFNGSLGAQWQWNANPSPHWFSTEGSALRLFSQLRPQNSPNLWMAPNLLLQKFPAEEFRVTTKLKADALKEGEETGLISFGLDYATLVIQKKGSGILIDQRTCQKANNYQSEVTNGSILISATEIWLQATVTKGGIVHFEYSEDGIKFTAIGTDFTAREGKWVGAKMGLYAIRPAEVGIGGSASYEFFRVNKP